jgi:uncharacterized membrane protein YjfL (UPF0719 family)
MNSSMRWVFGVCVAASLIMTAVALHLWGAAEIRASAGEVFFLTFFEAVWLLVATKLFPWLGLSFRDDAVERGNVAALVALCGAVMAVAIIYAGGSLGEGPSFMNNFFSAAVGTAGLFALWILLEFGAKVSRCIAEERDPASGLRLGGLLLGIGLVLGRAAAGNWYSAAATIQGVIHDGWSAAVLWGIALLVESFARPSRRRPFPAWQSFGLLPAFLYLALAAAWVWHLGTWEGMPRRR